MNTFNYKVRAGSPFPLGVTWQQDGINFSLVSSQASSVILALFDSPTHQPFVEIPLDPHLNKTGDIWHLFLATTLSKPLGYAYKLGGPSKYFDAFSYLLDPYAKAVISPKIWGARRLVPSKAHPLFLGLLYPEEKFDWEDDKKPQISHKSLIIYEMHVRGFTQHPSSQVKAPGTYLGMIEKIPYLQQLGINAVELLPIQEFNECEYPFPHLSLQKNLFQYWGYSSINFFAPMNRYAFSPAPGAALQEFKKMVKAFHKAGIAVILDIVLNHTNEGSEDGPLTSFKGIDCNTYYLKDKEDRFMNFTGCGNTFNTNHPILQHFILDVLRYWVVEMRVDGFRFDLASIFNRGMQGEVLEAAPIVEAISYDPVLSQTILIAEPWDAAGLYQVGKFSLKKNRWSEWNALYRDTVRRFIKGTPYTKDLFASRLAGSQDIYGFHSPLSSINFITAHDGFTLYDLIAYNHKHNLENGENNQDGTNQNESWNCGLEGPTDDLHINDLRERQLRNFHLALMMSQGIPMLQMGDEYAHTKRGNNNTWCQDNELNWFLWDKLQENSAFYRFYRLMIKFRKQTPALQQGRFLNEQDIFWRGTNGEKINWDKETQFLAFTLLAREENAILYCAFNAQNIPQTIVIPRLEKDQCWQLIINTANPSPYDFYEEGQEPWIEQPLLQMPAFSALLLKKKLN
ncbi:Isoamylase 1, chloroplastic|uniref:glycogen debranching protein n=1 Tax=Neochlamydia sp. AcF84 TaxID=2315858 RepID=UPI00140B1F8F|nr:isoamylase [Neochlamydia sp. AcF84]NGY95685.1 Isoamylase 1, chloroplastic [Neochlamydia sp. AcF84]